MLLSFFRLAALGVLCALPAIVSASSASEGRSALIIGNSDYATLDTLSNAVDDARAIADTLRGVGFEVTLVTNAKLSDMLAAVHRAAGAARLENGVFLFYYAGHGFQLDGANYLVPVDAALESAERIPVETVRLDELLSQLDSPDHQTIVFIDACRDNPLPSGVGVKLPGLATVTSGVNTYTAFATAPGGVSSDGADGHSPFTSALLRNVPLPDVPISTMMINVRRAVLEATAGLQDPWDNNSLRSDFYFNKGDYAAGVELQVATADSPASDAPAGKGAPAAAPEIVRSGEAISSIPARSDSGTAVAVPSVVLQPLSPLPSGASAGEDAASVNTSGSPLATAPSSSGYDKTEHEASLSPPNAPATVDVPVTVPTPSATPHPAIEDPDQLVANVQRELTRLACYSGLIDGDWGRASKGAAKRFLLATRTNLPGEPTSELLETLKRVKDPVCKESTANLDPASPASTEETTNKRQKSKEVTTTPAPSTPKAPKTPKPKSGPHLASATTVRDRPGKSSPAVGSISAGQSVSVDLCDGAWCYVTWSGGSGWVEKRIIAGR